MGKQKLLTVQIVARRLGVSDEHVRNLIKDGCLKAIRPGKKQYKISEAAYEAFLWNRRVDPEEYYQ